MTAPPCCKDIICPHHGSSCFGEVICIEKILIEYGNHGTLGCLQFARKEINETELSDLVVFAKPPNYSERLIPQ